jgi:hypothetical protein
MDPISQGVAGNAIWAGIVAAVRAAVAPKIKIIFPRPQETLSDAQSFGSGRKFPVRGVLRNLPKGYEIWLLVQDDSSQSVWPQGFSPVQFDPHQGTWTGWINGTGRSDVRIVAVLAPPTSQDFFRYFQQVGPLSEPKFQPLKRLPLECINRDSVQARVPKA